MFKFIQYFIDSFKVVDVSNKPIPCADCGACCNYFKVTFDRSKNQQVPVEKILIYKEKG
jgi:hypothetical protein